MEFDVLLKLMVEKDASDLFITAGMPASLRINGKVTLINNAPLSAKQTQALVTGLMTDKMLAEFEEEFECNFAINRKDIGRFRVSAFRQRNQVGMVVRKIETIIPTHTDLKLPAIINDLAMTKRGLVIMSGATGSGKSTSLAAMVGYRNHHSAGHIITIEDPIEFVHEHDKCIITQREVGIDTKTYDVALKNSLRQSPDVILIGEIRTRETMENAIAFAETGHLCLATLHSNNANQALDRMINFFPEDRKQQLLLDLSLNLRAIVAQQLLPTADGTGRIVAVEIMLNSPLVSDYIRTGEIHKLKEVIKNSRDEGMQTFDQSLFDLYRSGSITYDDALLYADSANDLRLMIKFSD